MFLILTYVQHGLLPIKYVFINLHLNLLTSFILDKCIKPSWWLINNIYIVIVYSYPNVPGNSLIFLRYMYMVWYLKHPPVRPSSTSSIPKQSYSKYANLFSMLNIPSTDVLREMAIAYKRLCRNTTLTFGIKRIITCRNQWKKLSNT